MAKIRNQAPVPGMRYIASIDSPDIHVAFNQGITPSSTATYTLASLTAAIEAESGVVHPSVQVLREHPQRYAILFPPEREYHRWSFQQIDALESGSCSTSSIKYPLKTHPNPPGLPAKATIHASSIDGLLSFGTWSTQTLATFTISGTMDSFTMTSSKGNCSVSGGTFMCGSGVSLTSFPCLRRFNWAIASQFTSGSCLLLASGGSTAWTSDGVPSGTTVFPVFAGSDHAQEYTLFIVST
ncbi:hypothetical protein B0H13DRAFT_1874640 [Mycena leptocephala]|nr:hypothetical protein B0H13DRAFT_1874640 [Mycena leptocephala]